MATNILSVSIPKDLAEFLDENPEVSPSKVLQSKLYEIKEMEQRASLRVKACETKTFRVVNKLQRVLDWAQSNGVSIPDNVLE